VISRWLLDAESLYGLEFMDIKKHLLKHAPEAFEHWGPWYTTWAYNTEVLSSATLPAHLCFPQSRLGNITGRLNTNKHSIFLGSLAWTEALRTYAEDSRQVLTETPHIDDADLAFLNIRRCSEGVLCGSSSSLDFCGVSRVASGV
jgi:hypothetical protein